MADTVFGKAATLMEGFDALCWYLVRIVATLFSLKAIERKLFPACSACDAFLSFCFLSST